MDLLDLMDNWHSQSTNIHSKYIIYNLVVEIFIKLFDNMELPYAITIFLILIAIIPLALYIIGRLMVP